MLAAEAPLGCSALLRVGGLPIRYWLSGASPSLFRKVEELERKKAIRRAQAMQLAERIGEQLVPRPTLSRSDRAFLLEIRRCLHRGDLIARVSRNDLRSLSGLADGDGELLEMLVATVDEDRAIASVTAQIEADLGREQDRLLCLHEQIIRESRVARALITADDGEEPPLASQLSRKSRRRHCDYAWHRISRATTGSTPRGWLSHVALLPLEAPGGFRPEAAVTGRFCAQWAENVRAPRLALANPPDDWPTPESRLAANPLRWDVDGRLVCVVLGKNSERAQVSVERSLLLNGIFAALDDRVQTFEELAGAVGCVTPDERLAFRGFVRHLVILGILQASAPPQIRLERWATPGESFARVPEVEDGHGGWVDVYRYAETGVSGDLAREVQRGLIEAFRLLSLLRNDSADPLPVPTTSPSWSVAEILRDQLAVDDKPSLAADGLETANAPPTSRFAELVEELMARAGNATEVVIGADLIDKWGSAPSGQLNWPVDCLVRVPRPGSDFTAVFEDLRAPGVLDARFADTLSEMHGSIPHVDAYRVFLRRLEELTGIRFVEVLVPPLTDGAANAVRRPLYTSAWTGDPHADGYLRRDADPGAYIPLNAIRIRRINGRLRAEVNGKPIWPVYHATRTLERPWSQVARVLLAAAPVHFAQDYEGMSHLPTILRKLLPLQTIVPRISVSGGIVLSPAQWRVPSDKLWDRGASAQVKLRSLIELRSRYSLPRWVYLLRDSNPPVPCDLESIHAFRAIERCAPGNTLLHFIEMLPAPDQLLIADRAHRNGDRLTSQLQLRFPCDESATTMADRIAPAVLTAIGSRGLPEDPAIQTPVPMRQHKHSTRGPWPLHERRK